ncbi:MAG: alpha/beta fold hydrolase [Spirochaetaceae bacterium]
MAKTDLAVHETGRRKGIPIVFLHGFLFTSRMWDRSVQALSESYRCIAYDQRGAGESPVGSGQYTIETLTDDLEAVLAASKLKSAYLVGHDLGGFVALRLAQRDPSRVRGLVLINSHCYGDADEQRLWWAALLRHIEKEGMKDFLKRFFPSLFAESSKTQAGSPYEQLLSDAERLDPVGVKGAILAAMTRTDTREVIDETEGPMLFLTGEKDEYAPPELVLGMGLRVEGAQAARVPDTGHVAPLEHPTFITNALTRFFSEFVPTAD